LGVAGFVIMLYSLFELVRTKRRRVGLDRGETLSLDPPRCFAVWRRLSYEKGP
jgi:hypothetical protein